MNKQTFIQLIKNPSGISPEQLLELEKVVGGFPYCQSAYILIAKQAAETGSMLADQKIKKAAAYTLDRKNLKRILYGAKELVVNEIKNISEPTITPFENQIEELRTKEEIEKVIEEKIIEEQIIIKDTSSIVTEENNASKREPLTDEQRDQILKELKENLTNLHALKNTPSTNELPKEIIELKEIVSTPKNVEIETIPTIVEPEIALIENKEVPIVESLPSSNLQKEWFETNLSIAPIRTEDVIVEIQEKEAESEVLLSYLSFLEEKRSVFRKNKKKEVAIIAKIILDDPTIPKLDINNLPDNSIDLSSKSSIAFKGPVSENFAKILGLQGKKEKAIEIYEQLILKNPEKKPYFESQIEKLKNKI